MDNTLLKEFDVLASVTRKRSNSIANKLEQFIASEIDAKKSITSISASELDVEKIHIQTLYNALRKNKIAVKRGDSFVVENIDAHYVSKAIIKLA